MEKLTGTVKWFNDQKGYGFLTDGERVEFSITDGAKGKQAVDVVVVY